jgi:hypothetical protein
MTLMAPFAALPIEDAGAAVTPGVILVKGAWSSASDVLTPLPQGGRVEEGVYRNEYFGISYALSERWTQRYDGPPPSDNGYFVLAQIEPSDELSASMPGHLMIAAQDLFFTPLPVSSPLELINYMNSHLSGTYRVETAPSELRLANRSFVRFDYMAPASGLHWRIFATQMRCHVVQFIYTGRDLRLLDRLSDGLHTMQTRDQDSPVCIKDYASSAQRIAGENPIFTERRFNPIPVRIIIGTDGRVRHVHVLSAFPDQATRINQALSNWRFKPYLLKGRAMEVETGLSLGRVP